MEDLDDKRFVLTSAIHYMNGPPHIGHAYENIIADCIVRFYRLLGRDAYLISGSDEHGLKMLKTAESMEYTAQELSDRNTKLFQDMNKLLNIRVDSYVRTSSSIHQETVYDVFRIIEQLSSSDIYSGKYKGWYDVANEKFVTNREAKADNFRNPSTGREYVFIEEPAYFFKMEGYRSQIIKHIQENVDFIRPVSRRNEILERLKEPLTDLCISRSKFPWGIQLPHDSSQVVYVWFDALIAYITGTRVVREEMSSDIDSSGSSQDHISFFEKYVWPADVHLIGKDIIWFHTVIWSAILLSANLPLSKTVFAHGFILDEAKEKVSKTIGNIIDPIPLVEKFSSDALRFALLRDGRIAEDSRFSKKNLILRYNGELANELGNLLTRVLSLLARYNNSLVPEIPDKDKRKIFDSKALLAKIQEYFSDFKLNEALFEIIQTTKKITAYISEEEPWKIKEKEKRDPILYNSLQGIGILAYYYLPFIPESAAKIIEELSLSKMQLKELDWDLVKPNTKLKSKIILFPKFDLD